MKLSLAVCFSLVCSIAHPTFGDEQSALPRPTGETPESIPIGVRESATITRDSETRLWTLTDGRQAAAKLVDRVGDRVLLEDSEKKRFHVPTENFCQADIAHIDRKFSAGNSPHERLESDVIATLLVVLQGSPLLAIENSLDLLDQVSGADLVATLQGQSTKTVTKSYSVEVPVTEQVTVMQERFVRRCIRGRWVCVREVVPVQRSIQRLRTESRTKAEIVTDEEFVGIMEALKTYTEPPTTPEERTQIKRLLLQAYAILSARGDD